MPIIQASLKDLGLVGKEDIEMVITPSGVHKVNSDIVLRTPTIVFSDSAGDLSASAPSGLPVRIRIPQAKIDIYTIVPNSGTIDVSDLL